MRKIDIINKKFNRLLVLEENKNKKGYYQCLCDCGKVKLVSSKNLRKGKTKSCGCLQKEIVSTNSKVDHTGSKFSKLLVIKRIPEKPLTKYLCLCDCGNEIIVYGCSLKNNHTKSCGCIKRNKKSRKHILYNTWKDMKCRCNNKNLKNYKYYGGRGIKICSGWSNSFESFLKDMGEKSNPKLSIDRIDNNKHYSCGKCEECIKNNWEMNCRWATSSQQNLNKRKRYEAFKHKSKREND